MGFGHRVYKVRDPRADVLSQAAEQLYDQAGDRTLYDLARAVEETALRLLEEYKPGRNLQTNLEYYTALVLHGVGLSAELFTPTFAVGRVGVAGRRIAWSSSRTTGLSVPHPCTRVPQTAAGCRWRAASTLDFLTPCQAGSSRSLIVSIVCRLTRHEPLRSLDTSRTSLQAIRQHLRGVCVGCELATGNIDSRRIPK